LLPKEINDVFKKLQKESPALVYPEVESILLLELGKEKLDGLVVDPTPVGAASLGQVHRAVEKSSGRVLALKVKYPGVEDAIESDLKILKRLLGAAGLIPRNLDLSIIFDEAHRMLSQEVDYRRESELLSEYRDLLKGDERFVIPTPIPEYSTSEVLAMSFEEGVNIDSPEVEALSQERKNRLALNFFDLFMREVTVFGKVQTDPHFGNYQIRLDPKGENDQWVLFDFGALRDLEESFLEPYLFMLRSSFKQDRDATHRALIELGLLATFEETDYAKTLISLCFLVTEPVLTEGEYDWAHSTLPEQAVVRARPYMFDKNVRLPPPQMLSLDRKVGGVFTMMVKLKAKIHTKTLVKNYLFNS
ncbi:MAG: ABC1 kinase family protein, partial [Pseudomonadota bacterium]